MNIHNKKVVEIQSRILNPQSDFKEKKLCDGPTFSAGSACVFSCRYCYVEAMMNRGTTTAVNLAVKGSGKPFQKLVLRKKNAVNVLEKEVLALNPSVRQQKLVVFSSPAVDVAATMTLVEETIALAVVLFKHTNWDIRLLSKSPLIKEIANRIPAEHKHRVIYGLSTGTLDDVVAKAVEPDAPPPSKRLQALRDLQQSGHRTFAMLCPILPQDLVGFTKAANQQINFSKCEGVWAEVLNRRGKSMNLTAEALEEAKLPDWANKLHLVYGKNSTPQWEAYARSAFAALTAIIPSEKLHFLQYVTSKSLAWWHPQIPFGAIPLGKTVKQAKTVAIKPVGPPPLSASPASSPQQTNRTTTPLPNPHATSPTPPLSPAKKAWITMRQRYTPEKIRVRSQAAAKKAHETMRRNSFRASPIIPV